MGDLRKDRRMCFDWRTVGIVLMASVLATSCGYRSEPSTPTRALVEQSSGDLGVPAGVYEGLMEVGGGLGGSFNSYEWDAESQKLLVHYNGSEAEIRDRLAASLPPSSFELVEDPYPVSALEAEAQRLIASGTTIDGMPITSAGPLPDGTGIQIFVEATPEDGYIPEVPEDLSDFPVEVAVRGKPMDLGLGAVDQGSSR